MSNGGIVGDELTAEVSKVEEGMHVSDFGEG